MKNSFIVDTDSALFNDDFLALLILATCKKFPIAVTTVAGNVSSVLSARLTSYLYYGLLDYDRVVIIPGAQRPLFHRRSPDYTHLHGYWDTDMPVESPLNIPSYNILYEEGRAQDEIVRFARKNPGLNLLCLGPLTNLALALQREPALPSLIDRVVIMGGAFLDRFPYRGNVTPKAEFNFWVDPDAADEVLNSGLSCEVVPINVCSGFFLDKEFASGWMNRNNSVGEAFRTVFKEPFDLISTLTIPMYDQIAAVAFLQPKLFAWEDFKLKIIKNPSCDQGTCKITMHSALPKVRVAVKVDYQSIRSFLLNKSSSTNNKF